jgi:hypothetical protein
MEMLLGDKWRGAADGATEEVRPPFDGLSVAERHIPRGFRFAAIGFDAAMLPGIRGDAFATAPKT